MRKHAQIHHNAPWDFTVAVTNALIAYKQPPQLSVSSAQDSSTIPLSQPAAPAAMPLPQPSVIPV